MSFSMHLAFALLSVLYMSGVLSAGDSLTKDDIWVGRDELTHEEASKDCEAKSMKLLSIQSTAKNEQLAEVLKSRGTRSSAVFWTSGQKSADDAKWTWVTGDEVTDFSWGQGEPNADGGSGGKCITVSLKRKKSVWDDRLCEEKHDYICEKQSK